MLPQAEHASGAHSALPFSPFSFSSVSIHSNVSKIAQESLREIRNLRNLLSQLLTTVETNKDSSDEESSDDSDVKNENSAVCAVVSSGCQLSSLDPTDNHLNATTLTLQPSFLPKIINTICESLETLDQLASRLQMNRMSSRFGELGLINALSLLTTVDQLDFGNTVGCGDQLELSTNESRRSDWFNDRTSAERWSSRYWERTHTVMEGLLSCSVFRRSHLNSDMKRHRIDSWSISSRDFRADLEHLLSDIQFSCPRLNLTVFDSGSAVLAVHVRVGDVMQCLITFLRLHPESIIVRGLTENVVLDCSTNSDSSNKTTSKAVAELLSSQTDSSMRDLLSSLLVPDLRAGGYHDGRGKRPGTQPRSVNVSTLSIQQLDMITPSRFVLFRRITSLAKCALLHFSNDYQPPSAVRGLLFWLHSYHDLFTAPCVRCGHLLGQGVTLPLWRTYPQLRKDDHHSMEAQHEHCHVIG